MRRAFVFVLAGALLLRGERALATMVTPMPLARVAREAARIVEATVVDVQAGRDESGLPATWITLDVTRSVKGRDAGRITIKQYGVGTPLDDGIVTTIAGLPSYHPGDEVVLFLRAESRRGFTSPVGLAQGTYRVRRAGSRRLVRGERPGDASRDVDQFLSEVGVLAGPTP